MVDDKRLYEVKTSTLLDFGKLWVENFKANQSLISGGYQVGSLFEKFKGVPAVIVGAGPSLDKNIHHLHSAHGRALIIGVDTILHSLDKMGLRPDLVVALDPQPSVGRFFEGVDTKGLMLVAPTIISPAALESWKGEVVFYNKFAPDVPQLVQIGQMSRGTEHLIPGGSVLSVGLSLAYKMGANPIAFAGQDLSYPPGQAYSQNTIYGDGGYEELLAQKLGDMVEDTDIFGRTVPTQKSLFITKQWMEWAFTTWKRNHPADFYNCTEGGIVRDHCNIVSLEEWTARFCKKEMKFGWAFKKALTRKKR